ncbi:MAG: hypothetical protein LBV08_06720 [Clostridiales bacterium]|nr:hypothetical protein [Clostridiales bacterium]
MAKKGSTYTEVLMAAIIVISAGAAILSNIQNMEKQATVSGDGYNINLVTKNILDRAEMYLKAEGVGFFTENEEGSQILTQMGLDYPDGYQYEAIFENVNSGERFVLPMVRDKGGYPSIESSHYEGLFPSSDAGLNEDILIVESEGHVEVQKGSGYVSVGEFIEADLRAFERDVIIKYISDNGKGLIIYNGGNDVYFKAYSENLPTINYFGSGALYSTRHTAREDYFIVINVYDEKQNLVNRLGSLVGYE